MSLYNVLFCANFLLYGVNSFSEYLNPAFFEFSLSKNGLEGLKLSTEYQFEEGLEYSVRCKRHSDWDLQWQVEPYELKSTIFSSSFYMNHIEIVFKLHRDDQITITCYSKNITNFKEEKKSTRFSWDTHTLLTNTTNDAGQKFNQKNNMKKAAYLTPRYNYKKYTRGVDLQFYYIIINQDNIISSNQDDSDKVSGNVNELSENVNYVWVPAVAGVTAFAVLSVVCFICYIKVVRKRIQNENIYDEPYSEIQTESNGQLSSREGTRIGTVENLYTEIK